MTPKKKAKNAELSPSEQFKQRWRKQRIPGVCRLKTCSALTLGKTRYCPRHQAELSKLANAKAVAAYRENLVNGKIAMLYVDKNGDPTPYAVTKAKNAVRLLRGGGMVAIGIPKRGEAASAYLQKLAELVAATEA